VRTAALALALALGCVASLVLGGCGSQGQETSKAAEPSASTDPLLVASGVTPSVDVDLVAHRSDKSTFRVTGDAIAWCGDEPDDYWRVGALTVMLRLGRDEAQAMADIEVARGSVEAGGAVEFPADVSTEEPNVRGGTLFVTDPSNEDELSSQVEEGEGTMTVTTAASCTPGSTFAITVDSALGSEVSDNVVSVSGTVGGTIGPEPDWDALEAAVGEDDEG
jgi:hypothetical protein